MSESGAIDYLGGDLQDILMQQADRIRSLEAAHGTAQRADEGMLALEMRMARMRQQSAKVLSPMDVMFLVGAVSTYMWTGLKTPWMEEILREVGR